MAVAKDEDVLRVLFISSGSGKRTEDLRTFDSHHVYGQDSYYAGVEGGLDTYTCLVKEEGEKRVVDICRVSFFYFSSSPTRITTTIVHIAVLAKAAAEEYSFGQHQWQCGCPLTPQIYDTLGTGLDYFTLWVSFEMGDDKWMVLPVI